MNMGFFGIPWFAWAGGSLAVGVLYAFVLRHRRISENSGFRRFILRWGHALVWLLLAINFLLRGISSSFEAPANIFALAGGLLYLLFINTTFIVKQ